MTYHAMFSLYITTGLLALEIRLDGIAILG